MSKPFCEARAHVDLWIKRTSLPTLPPEIRFSRAIDTPALGDAVLACMQRWRQQILQEGPSSLLFKSVCFQFGQCKGATNDRATHPGIRNEKPSGGARPFLVWVTRHGGHFRQRELAA